CPFLWGSERTPSFRGSADMGAFSPPITITAAFHEQRRQQVAEESLAASAGSLHAAMVDPFWAMSPVLPRSRGWAYGEAPTRFYAALSQTGRRRGCQGKGQLSWTSSISQEEASF
ncbi:unnamed protein product, partial [Musa hybrid cultivar]